MLVLLRLAAVAVLLLPGILVGLILWNLETGLPHWWNIPILLITCSCLLVSLLLMRRLQK